MGKSITLAPPPWKKVTAEPVAETQIELIAPNDIVRVKTALDALVRKHGLVKYKIMRAIGLGNHQIQEYFQPSVEVTETVLQSLLELFLCTSIDELELVATQTKTSAKLITYLKAEHILPERKNDADTI